MVTLFVIKTHTSEDSACSVNWYPACSSDKSATAEEECSCDLLYYKQILQFVLPNEGKRCWLVTNSGGHNSLDYWTSFQRKS